MNDEKMYRLYLFFNSKIGEALSVITFIACGVNALFSLLEDDKKIWIEITKSLLPICILIIASKLCHFRVKKSLKKSGGLYTNSQIIKNNFIFQPDKRAFDVKVENVNNDLEFIPVTQEKTDHIAQMHRAAYSKTVWRADVEAIKKRNIAHLKKHNECIMLIKPTGWEEDFGFTHLVAVSQKTWYRFEQGNIGCAELAAREIAPSNIKTSEPYGLILISAAMNPENKKLKDKKDGLTHDQIGRYLIQAIAHHIDQYLKREFSSQATVPVMFQTIRPKLITAFIQGQNTKQLKYSKEQARIVTFDVNNIHCSHPEDCFCIG